MHQQGVCGAGRAGYRAVTPETGCTRGSTSPVLSGVGELQGGADRERPVLSDTTELRVCS